MGVCPVCKKPLPGGQWLCPDCRKVLYPDWDIRFRFVGRKRGVGGGDYDGYRKVDGQYRKVTD